MRITNRTCLALSNPRSFTLTELLVVVFIMALITGMAAPLFNLIFRSEGLTATAGDVEQLLEQARSYAMGKNTYVYVGIIEVDDAQQGPSPLQTAVAGVGRLVVAVISSQDGTSGFDPTSSSNPIWTAYNGGASLSAMSKLRTFSNIHLTDLSSSMNGNLVRPSVASTPGYNLGTETCQSVTPFAWPLGRNLNSGQYNFTKVIQFTPQGSASVILASNGEAIPQWIEIGLTPTHGNILPISPTTGNQVVLQINGVSGGVSIYRP